MIPARRFGLVRRGSSSRETTARRLSRATAPKPACLGCFGLLPPAGIQARSVCRKSPMPAVSRRRCIAAIGRSSRRRCFELTAIAWIAEIRSCRLEQRCVVVWPLGANVRRSVGVGLTPDSPRKNEGCSSSIGALSCPERLPASPSLDLAQTSPLAERLDRSTASPLQLLCTSSRPHESGASLNEVKASIPLFFRSR